MDGFDRLMTCRVKEMFHVNKAEQLPKATEKDPARRKEAEGSEPPWENRRFIFIFFH